MSVGGILITIFVKPLDFAVHLLYNYKKRKVKFMEWLQEVMFVLPNWAWLAIAVAVVLLVIIIIAVCVSRGKKKKAAENQSEKTEAEPIKEEAAPTTAPAEPVKEEKAEPVKEAPAVVEKKPAAKPAVTKSAANSDNKVYHISKRKDDGKWQIKIGGGAKAIKLFDTQAAAIEYAKTLADNQDARIMIHKEDGSFRKLTYKK